MFNMKSRVDENQIQIREDQSESRDEISKYSKVSEDAPESQTPTNLLQDSFRSKFTVVEMN
jgi:hypothetical protein